MLTTSKIDPNSILTEGKLDDDLFEDPAMVLVDLENGLIHEAEMDLLLGHVSDMELVDIVSRDEPEFTKLDDEEIIFD